MAKRLLSLHNELERINSNYRISWLKAIDDQTHEIEHPEIPSGAIIFGMKTSIADCKILNT